MASPPSTPIGSPDPWRGRETALYHITHVRNIESIVACGCLHCETQTKSDGLCRQSIGYPELKARRSAWPVRVGPGDTLADYVPFYFAPRSPMLFVIHKGGVTGYSGGQDEVVHLVTSVERVVAAGTEFVITDGHAATSLTKASADLDGLEAVDWAIMTERYWNDSDDDGDRKRRRQAEFLAHKRVPIGALAMIGVPSAAVAAEVERVVGGLAIAVDVRRDWYY